MIEYAQDTSSRVLPLVQYIGQFSSIINWIAGGIKVFTESRLAVDQKRQQNCGLKLRNNWLLWI
ncbi:hypothetical protein OVX87_29610 [Klebsiella pneumoniae]|nr:hypothetical protein [Klebsiella pneumoniae]MDQ6121366.1 hypothetical protein [Klebsiella pneumoniae subsp. pneumoniae]